MARQPKHSDAIIRVRDITVQFGKTRVLDGLNLDVKRGEILGFVGPSGAGKSVLTRTIIGLVPKVAGRIEVFGVDLDAANAAQRRGVERRWGILFQQGALFSSLTVRQNIQFPVREYLKRLAASARRDHGGQARHGRPASRKSPTVFPRNSPAA